MGFGGFVCAPPTDPAPRPPEPHFARECRRRAEAPRQAGGLKKLGALIAPGESATASSVAHGNELHMLS
jgi:hypothetical protein